VDEEGGFNDMPRSALGECRSTILLALGVGLESLTLYTGEIIKGVPVGRGPGQHEWNRSM
jgi:hypothetical protein